MAIEGQPSSVWQAQMYAVGNDRTYLRDIHFGDTLCLRLMFVGVATGLHIS